MTARDGTFKPHTGDLFAQAVEPLASGIVRAYGPGITAEPGSNAYAYDPDSNRIVRDTQMPKELSLIEERALQHGEFYEEESKAYVARTAGALGLANIYDQLDGQAYLASGLEHTFLAFPAVRYSDRPGDQMTFYATGEHHSFDAMLKGARLSFPEVFNRLDAANTAVRLAEQPLANGEPVFDFARVNETIFRSRTFIDHTWRRV